MSEREEWADMIRNEYDPVPSHYRMGDDWNDGAGRIADAILADKTLLLRKHADRLADVVMMLDTPGAYNREYIAAVCRSILSSVTSGIRERKPPCPGCDGHECDAGCQYPGVKVQEPRTAAGSLD